MTIKLASTLVLIYQCPTTPDYPRIISGLTAPWVCEMAPARARDYAFPYMIGKPRAGGGFEEVRGARYGAYAEEYKERHADKWQYIPARLDDVNDWLSNTALVVEQAGLPTRYSWMETVDPRKAMESIASCGQGVDGGTMQGMRAYDWDQTGLWTYFTRGPSPFWDYELHPINQNNCIGADSFHNGGFSSFRDGSVQLLFDKTDTDGILALLSKEGKRYRPSRAVKAPRRRRATLKTPSTPSVAC